MYESYPVSEQPREPQRVQPPQSVRQAVRLMYAGAVLEVLSAILALVTRGSLKSAILTRHPGYTPAQLHTAEAAGIVPLLVGAVITIGLWLWMARANGTGRRWARPVSAVLFGISTVSLIISLFLVHATGTLIVGVVIWLVGLGAIILIFRKDSGSFYQERSGGRPS